METTACMGNAGCTGCFCRPHMVAQPLQMGPTLSQPRVLRQRRVRGKGRGFSVFCVGGGGLAGLALPPPAPRPTAGLRIHSCSHVPPSLSNHPPAAAGAAPTARFCAHPSAPVRLPCPCHGDPHQALGKHIPALEGAREVAKSRPHFSRARSAVHLSRRAAPAQSEQGGAGRAGVGKSHWFCSGKSSSPGSVILVVTVAEEVMSLIKFLEQRLLGIYSVKKEVRKLSAFQHFKKGLSLNLL